MASLPQTIDLGGMDEAQVRAYVKENFEESISGTGPVKFTFIIGAGKAERQKYHPDLSKYMISALRDVGFDEDRAASACVECMGTFKSQHDTSKNLKFIHVFPRIKLDIETQETDDKVASSSKHSIELLCASCEFSTFQEMVGHKTQSWGQRKRLCVALQNILERFEEAEKKMIRMEALSPDEQVIFDSTSTDLLSEKIQWLSSTLKQMADQGELTKKEKIQVLSQIDSKLEALGSGPKVEKQKELLKKRHAHISSMSPISHPLQCAAEIEAVLVKLWTVERLEAIKGRLLTMPELKLVGEKSDLETQLRTLEEESKGWFEDELDFQMRMDLLKAKVSKVKSSSESKPKTSNTSSTDGWETVGTTKGPAKGRRK